jgi:hypothetical protein
LCITLKSIAGRIQTSRKVKHPLETVKVTW